MVGGTSVSEPTRPYDWTERHRPTSARQLEGNEPARKRIRTWLEGWKGATPKKRGALLVGPPGVGKTTIARAIAADHGWHVVELNASDERNAAAVRKAIGTGATSTSLDMFAPGGGRRENARTLLLLDEVDHLHGSLAKISEGRIERSLDGEDDTILKGDSGGKAELLRLLQTTSQPILLACNDEMGLWGRGGGWREARDRFTRHCEIIRFDRASPTALKRIAARVLEAEGATCDAEGVELLVRMNRGDLRALVKDLQQLVEASDGHVSVEQVRQQVDVAVRDEHHDTFPGIEKLYRTRLARSAAELTRTLDIDPDQLTSWVAWNNASIWTDGATLRRGAGAVRDADAALGIRFRTTAYRSTYWGAHLASLAASAASPAAPPGKIWIRYPSFLRRGFETWRRGELLTRLAATCGASRQAAQEELLPPLQALHAPDLGGDPDDFRLSLALGFEAAEHLMLTGLPASRRQSKAIVKAYEEAQEAARSTLPALPPLSAEASKVAAGLDAAAAAIEAEVLGTAEDDETDTATSPSSTATAAAPSPAPPAATPASEPAADADDEPAKDDSQRGLFDF